MNKAKLATIYKEAAEVFFTSLAAEADSWSRTITIEDIEYLSGYFIFDFGENAVVHFHIKETPGWKYGVWFNLVGKSSPRRKHTRYYKDRLECRVFAQYEEEIDKFKPGRSTICETIPFSIKNGKVELAYMDKLRYIEGQINFIHSEPYLAFYRDVHSTDFNQEHITRAKAKAYFEKYFKEKRARQAVQQQNDEELLAFYKDLLKDDLAAGNCFIWDREECCSPRYDIVIKNIWEANIEPGWYGLEDLVDNWDEAEARLDAIVTECNKRADAVDSWYFENFHRSARVVNLATFEEFLNDPEILKVNFNYEVNSND